MVKVMNEAGIDVSGQESKGVDGYPSAGSGNILGFLQESQDRVSKNETNS
jgi:hypothetical protein